MAKNFILIIFLFFSIHDFGQNFKTPVIQPGKGLGDIVIESSTLDTVIILFGKNKIKEHSVKGCGTWGDSDCGKENYVTYKNIGVTFLCEPKMTDKVVRLIVLKKPCQYKTDKGIGIGNSKSDIVTKYGQPVSELKTDNDNRLEYSGITYILDKKEQDKVAEIIIYGPE